MIFPQPLLILIALLIPLFLIFKNRHQNLIQWIGFICVVDIFNSQQYLNLSAFKLAGFILIPYIIKDYKLLLTSKPFKILLVYFLYLCLLGCYFGIINPWVDPIKIRVFKDLSLARSILHLGSLFLELIVILYLSLNFKKNENIDHFFYAVFAGILFINFGAILEYFFRIDLYKFFTNGSPMLLMFDRPRGFTYEPRGLAQNTAIGILLSYFYINHIKNKKFLFIFIPLFLIIIYFGLIKAMSTTGYITLFLGTITIFISQLYLKQISLNKKTICIFFSIIVLFPSIYFLMPEQTQKRYIKHFTTRNSLLLKTELIERFEDQEAAAINFFIQNPRYSFLGTGPGLIYIPSVAYRIDKYLHIDTDKNNQFNYLPHMGSILQFSNSGIIGCIFLFFLIRLCILELKKTKKDYLSIFLLLTTLYFFQIRLIYYAGLALGLSRTFNFKKRNDLKNKLS